MAAAFIKMEKNKRLIIIGIFVLLVLSFFVYDKFLATGNVTETIQGAPVEIVPLSQAQVEKVASTLLESDFIKDVPKKNPISLQFYDFSQGQRIWQSGFLMADSQLLSEGKPTVQLILHSKYISEINAENLCEVIKKAKKNGDLGFYSESNKASLLIKYAGMLEHRNCFGI